MKDDLAGYYALDNKINPSRSARITEDDQIFLRTYLKSVKDNLTDKEIAILY